MASPLLILAALLAAILFFSVVGLALARWIAADWADARALAPALGWGVFTAVGLPLQTLIGLGADATTGLAVLALGAATLGLWAARRAPSGEAPRLPVWAFALAAAVAVLPLAALLPKSADGGVIIGTTAFDHSKIAMIDEMRRLGLPAGNPFFGAGGGRSTLPYYFLWHFSAAQLSLVLRISGWEADAALTGFTAYASLTLVMGLAARWSARGPGKARPGAAAAWVALISLTGSLRPLLSRLLGQGGLERLLSHYRGLAGWMVQASWVPQHLASACCVVLSVLLLIDLARRPRALVAAMAGALAAAGFGSSAWVGGVTFVFLAAAAGLIGLKTAQPRRRIAFIVGAGAAAVTALILSIPMLQAEFGSLPSRQGGSPVGLHPYEVVGAWAPPALARWLDLPAYWLMLLPIELPAIYPVGLAVLALRRRDGGPDRAAAMALVLVSLCTAWLLISTIGNNDLGWRAILPAVLVLSALTAGALAQWTAAKAWVPAGLAIALILASLPDHQIEQNLQGRPSENAPDFAGSPELWAAVRRYAGPADRVANNPGFLDDLTDWPVNPSWAMLSDRPSCFSGWETARAYVALPAARITALDDQFTRVFEGRGSPADVRQMARDYGCKVAVLVPSDAAWGHDPFAASPDYRLAEAHKDRWRIYVAVKR
jgi:hypothetical protein